MCQSTSYLEPAFLHSRWPAHVPTGESGCLAPCSPGFPSSRTSQAVPGCPGIWRPSKQRWSRQRRVRGTAPAWSPQRPCRWRRAACSRPCPAATSPGPSLDSQRLPSCPGRYSGPQVQDQPEAFPGQPWAGILRPDPDYVPCTRDSFWRRRCKQDGGIVSGFPRCSCSSRLPARRSWGWRQRRARRPSREVAEGRRGRPRGASLGLVPARPPRCWDWWRRRGEAGGRHRRWSGCRSAGRSGGRCWRRRLRCPQHWQSPKPTWLNVFSTLEYRSQEKREHLREAVGGCKTNGTPGSGKAAAPGRDWKFVFLPPERLRRDLVGFLLHFFHFLSFNLFVIPGPASPPPSSTISLAVAISTRGLTSTF